MSALTLPARPRRRMIIAAVLLALLVAAGLVIGRVVLRTNYYVAANNGTVSILRGVQGSILGIRLQDPYRLGCLDASGALQQISPGDFNAKRGCRLLTLDDLRAPARQQVANGLPTGTVDNAIKQLDNLSKDLLPVCPPPAPKPSPRQPPAPTAPAKPTPGVPQPPSLADLPPAEPEPGVECRPAA